MCAKCLEKPVMGGVSPFICTNCNKRSRGMFCLIDLCYDCSIVLNKCTECGETAERKWLAESERAILGSLNRKYKYITRDFDGDLYLFCDEPFLYNDMSDPYDEDNGKIFVVASNAFPDIFDCISFVMYNHAFKSLNFIDSPYLIADLL